MQSLAMGEPARRDGPAFSDMIGWHDGYRPRVYLVRDGSGAGDDLPQRLRAAGYDVLSISRREELTDVARRLEPDLAIFDTGAPSADTFASIRELRHVTPFTHILIVSCTASWDLAVEAMRAGVCDWVHSCGSEAIVAAVARALDRLTTRENGGHDATTTESHAFARLADKAVAFTRSPQDKPTLSQIGRVLGASCGALRNWCRTARIPARSFRDFARALRAVSRHQRDPSIAPENLLDIVDRRTLKKFLVTSGAGPDALPATLDDFLRLQRFIRDPDVISAVRLQLCRAGLLPDDAAIAQPILPMLSDASEDTSVDV